MVTVYTLKKEITEQLEKAGIPDAVFETRCLLEDFAGGCASDEPLSETVEKRIRQAVDERIGGRPLQYILGQWDFLNLRLRVGEGVLIPRQDTELLCETVAGLLKHISAPRVLDLCAGSGCVGLGIASLVPTAQVTAVEKSDEAFAFLQENIKRYPHLQVRVMKGDILSDLDAVQGEFDVIVSNPPYIRSAVLPSLMEEVQREPQMALDGGEDGLLFYRVILEKWKKKLKPGGLCAVEIGFDQAEQVNGLFESNGFTRCTVQKDYGGNNRIVLGFLEK
jgi:release factor glutamine methyltransferase